MGGKGDRVERGARGFSDWVTQFGAMSILFIGALTAIDYVKVLDNNYIETLTELQKLDPESVEFAALNSQYGFWTEVLSKFGPQDMTFVTELKNPGLWGATLAIGAAFATKQAFRS